MDNELLGRTHRDPPANAPRSRTSALFGGPPIGDFDSEPTDHAGCANCCSRTSAPPGTCALCNRRSRDCAPTCSTIWNAKPARRPVDRPGAAPLPILVICDLLGVPYADRDRFRLWVDDAAFSPDDDVSLKGLESLIGYGMELVSAKRAHPDDDVISRLCDEPDLADFEIATLAMQLLFAGHETTVTQIWSVRWCC